ncbi:hypothetical protein WQ54_19715 [Bacillus sp. SA1-12]|uniref:oligogalacturonate lyase family protein n=1 Tax=Bacillus sp. SA1-12 TaxID=1455638 RepID=UPI0006271D98|nr:oligogalacturonate lyase family protein [Bacillus sp. SA1-12]KKI90219.1 hypothetical protein WQ54_19715 [Bacillus sp. SA1-12]
MTKGRIWPTERKSFHDPITGAAITQLTDYFAHSYHLYFTNNAWYDSNTKLLIGSDRENSTNLYSIDLLSGELTQLTELKRNQKKSIQGTFINPIKMEAYFTLDRNIFAINLETYQEKTLFELPHGFHFSNLSCTADGNHLCFGLTEDLSHSLKSNLSGGYIGFEETEAARPHCQIWLLTLDTGDVKIIHEDQLWIGHINASPTQPNLITFCHEGPWEKVDHRIWLLDIDAGRKWKVAEGEPNQYAGHEYWHADGLRIGYHGFTDSLERKDGKFLGSVKFDNTECERYHFPYQNMHIHSKDNELIVGDGQQTTAYHGSFYQDCLFLWKKHNDLMEGPRVLCKHRGSFHIQQVHVHPCFSPDGTKILFTSDMSGYGNVYLVDVPAFDTLPILQNNKLVK